MNSTSTIILEAQFFPPIESFARIIQHTHLIIEACEHYQKGSYRNRCHIANSTGMQSLSVPLSKGKNSKQPIREVQISYDLDWQKQHWQSLQTAYGSAPYWEYYAPIFERIFSQKYQFLFEYNMEILKTLFKILKLNNSIDVSLSTTYEKTYDASVQDIRNTITPRTNPIYNIQYAQLFQDRLDFLPNMSILDLIFCTGPRSVEILKSAF
jgi:WbqC-like protein family